MPDNDLLKVFYDNLIKSGRVDEKSIGSYDVFKANIADSNKAKLFYDNLIKTKKFSPKEIGDWDQFSTKVKTSLSSEATAKPGWMSDLEGLPKPISTDRFIPKIEKPTTEATIPTASGANRLSQTFDFEKAQAHIDQKIAEITDEINNNGSAVKPEIVDTNIEGPQATPSGDMPVYDAATNLARINPLLTQRDYYHDAKDMLALAKRKGKVQTAGDGLPAIAVPFAEAWTAFKSPLAKDYANLGLTYMIRNMDLLEVRERATAGHPLRDAEKTLLTAAGILQAVKNEDQSIAAQTGGAMEAMIPYMIQFGLTGGIGTGVQAGVNGLLESSAPLVGKGLWKYFTGQGLKKMLAYTAGAAAQTPFMPSTYTNIQERMIGDISPEGKVMAFEAMPKAIAKGYGDMFVEVFTENLGPYLMRGSQAGLYKGVSIAAGEQGLPRFRSLSEKVAKATGFSRWYEEFAEEVASNIMQPIVVDQQLPDVTSKEWWKQQLVTGITVAAMGGAFYMADVGGKIYDEQSSRAKYLRGLPEEVKKGVISSVNSNKNVQEIADDVLRYSDGLSVDQTKNIITYALHAAARNESEEYRQNAAKQYGKQDVANSVRGEMQPYAFRNTTNFIQVTDKDNNAFWVKDGQIDRDAAGQWVLGSTPLDAMTLDGKPIKIEPQNIVNVNSTTLKDLTDKEVKAYETQFDAAVNEDRRKKNPFHELTDQEQKDVVANLGKKGITEQMVQDTWHTPVARRTKAQNQIMEDFLTSVKRFSEAKHAKIVEDQNTRQYINQFGYGKDKQYIITVTDKESQQPRFVLSGDLIITPQGEAIMGEKPLVVTDAQGRKSMVHPNMVGDIAATPSQQYYIKRMADFESEQQAISQETEKAEQMVNEFKDSQPQQFKVGDKIEFNGEEGEITDAKDPETGITAVFGDGTKVMKIKPEQYPEVTVTTVEAAQPGQPATGTTGEKIKLETKVGQGRTQIDFDKNEDGTYTSTKTFDNKAQATNFTTGLKNTYANISFSVENIADPNNIFAKNEFKIHAKPKAAKATTPAPAAEEINVVQIDRKNGNNVSPSSDTGPDLGASGNGVSNTATPVDVPAAVPASPMPSKADSQQPANGEPGNLSELDEPPIRKWSISAAESIENRAPILDISTIDLEKSGLEGFEEDKKDLKVQLLEYRGRNQHGVQVGTVIISGTLSDGSPFREKSEVFFKEGFSKRDLKEPPTKSEPKPAPSAKKYVSNFRKLPKVDVPDYVKVIEQTNVNGEITNEAYNWDVTLDDGSKVNVTWVPKWSDMPKMKHVVDHFEFKGEISSTGYRSHFIQQTYANQPFSKTEKLVKEFLEDLHKETLAEKAKTDKKAAKAQPKTQEEKVKEVLETSETPKSIKEIADATDIVEPNIRRILGVGAKKGTFKRVAPGVYALETPDGKSRAYIYGMDAVEALPKLAKQGFKADMVFLDIPYNTAAIRSGNRELAFDKISPEQFKIVAEALSKIVRDNYTPVFYMYSTSITGAKDMQDYTDALLEADFWPVAKGSYTKVSKSGNRLTMPMRSDPLPPEGIIVLSKSGKLPPFSRELNLDFTLIRPKGYATEKPRELLKSLIEQSTQEGDMVLDPFAGSGVAGEQALLIGRDVTLIEKSPEAVEGIKKRIEGAVEAITPEKPQIWELTKEEFSKAVYNGEYDFPRVGRENDSIQRSVTAYHATKDIQNKQIAKDSIDNSIWGHYQSQVFGAIRDKKDVPEKVLQQFPDFYNHIKQIRKENEEQPRSTEAIEVEGETLISEAENVTDSKQAGEVIEKITNLKDEIDRKLKLLGEYTTDIDHEMPNIPIEKEIKKDIVKYSKALARVLGWQHDVDKKGKSDYGDANLAPAGGNATFILWMPHSNYGIYVSVTIDQTEDYEKYSINEDGGDLGSGSKMLWRWTTKENKYRGLHNNYASGLISVGDLAALIEKEKPYYEKKAAQERQESGIMEAPAEPVAETKIPDNYRMPQLYQKVTSKKHGLKGEITKIFKPERGSALENEPFLINVKYDNGSSAINMKPDDYYFPGDVIPETETTPITPQDLGQLEPPPTAHPGYGSENTLVTRDKYEELKKRMRDKLNNLTAGIDPELMAIGTEMAIYHIESGARKFKDFAQRMISDLGDAIKPYLKSFYQGARYMPGMEDYRKQMDSSDFVDEYDLDAVEVSPDETIVSGRETIVSGPETPISAPEIPISGSEIALTLTTPIKVHKHTKTGEDMYVTAPVNRLERDVYKDYLKIAKDHQGNYSTFAKGFLFSTQALADKFRQAIENKFAGKPSSEFAGAQFSEGKPLTNDENITKFAENQPEDNGIHEGNRPVRNGASTVHAGSEAGVSTGNGERGNVGGLSTQTGEQSVSTVERPAETRNESDGRRGNDLGRIDVAAGEEGNNDLNEELGGKSEKLPATRNQGDPAIQVKNTRNFVIPPDFVENSSFSSSRTLDNNIDALEVLVRLIENGGTPTVEDQQKLFKYAGFGGLKEILKDVERSWNWASETERHKFRRVHDLIKRLDPDGSKGVLDGVRSSTANAHFTSIPVIRAIHEIVERTGFTGGRALEPSMGNGHFFGAMPRKLSKNTQLHGVEMDFLTGKIAQYLYPDALVHVSGLQDAPVLNNYYDLIISNIPFGDIRVSDASWANKKQAIYNFAKSRVHNYFFVKAIELAKPNGLIAFITTHNTLDAPGNELLRRHINDTAEFLGAIRLPDSAFQANAGTSVVTDIIFLRKFDEGEAAKQKHDFIKSEKIKVVHKDSEYSKYDVPMNEYFIKNPQNVIGELRAGGLYRDEELTVIYNGTDIAQRISEVGKKLIPRKIITQSKGTKEVEDLVASSYSGETGDYIRSGNVVMQDGKFGRLDITQNQYGEKTINFIPLPGKFDKDKLTHFIRLRNSLNKLMISEYQGENNDVLETLRNKLNHEYDSFVKKYGRLKDENNLKILDLDTDKYNLQGLERYDRKTRKFAGKADIFSKRTISSAQTITQVDSPEKAILVSLNETGKIDDSKMKALLGENWFDQVQGIVYELPEGGYDYRESYLSGNIREKLTEAEKALQIDPKFQKNVDDLKAILPKDIPAAVLFEFTNPGVRWIPTDYYTQFANELFELHGYNNMEVHYVAGTDKFVLVEPRIRNANITDKYGTVDFNGLKILEAVLNDTTLRAFDKYKDENGTEHRVFNPVRTQAINEKVSLIKEYFKSWLGKDQTRRNTLMRIYNDTFNSTVKRKFDGSHLTFPGLSGINPYPHQKDAVWMVLQNGGGMVDHMVGAGKTMVMILSAMEMRRLGIARKPLIVALKPTVNQIADSFRSAYPMAKVLAPTTADFAKEKRKQLMAQIATNDWDAVIISQEQYKALDHERSVQEQVINNELELLIESVEYFRQAEQNQMTKRQLKGLQKRIDNLRAKLNDLALRKTDPFTFERLGFDYMFFDESHYAKNLSYTTTFQNIAGLGDSKGNQLTFATMLGITHLHNLHQGDRGVTFLTGTPITNSLVELYLILKYLRPLKMDELGMRTFDAWAATFAEHTSETEFGVTNQLRQKDRFRRYINAPELAMLYSEIADVRNDNNLKLPKPKMKGGGMTMVNIEPSPAQLAFIELLVDLANNGMYSTLGQRMGMDERSETAKMLIATGLATKMTVDMRLADENAEDDPQSKVNVAVGKVAEIYKESDSYKGVQLIFSDVGVPGGKGVFNIYDDIRDKLVNHFGIPREQIAFIHDADNEKQKEALFEKTNNGEVRILLGSTRKLGTGVNVQERIVAMHHLDAPWTAASMDQRNGRGIRQGNKVAEEFLNNEVPVYAYAVERSLDAYKFQLLDIKKRFSEQVRQGDMDAGQRYIDEGAGAEGDEEASMGYAEFVSILSGNPLVLEKAKWDQKLNDLQRSRMAFEQTKYDAEEKVTMFKNKVQSIEKAIPRIKLDVKLLEDNRYLPDKDGKYPNVQTVNGKSYDKPSEAGEAILKILEKVKGPIAESTPIQLATAYGFTMYAWRTEFINNHGQKDGRTYYYVTGTSGQKYSSSAGTLSENAVWAGMAMTNALDEVGKMLSRLSNDLTTSKESITINEEIANKVWEKQDKLDEALRRRREIDAELALIEERENEHVVQRIVNEEHLTGGEADIEADEVDSDNPEENFAGTVAESREELRRELQTDFNDYAQAVLTGEAVPPGTSTEQERRQQERLTDPNPTDEQKKTGEYNKGEIRFHDMAIHIENARGSYRTGKDDQGREWSNKMLETYGYFARTEGKDGDEIDVFVGDNLSSPNVYIVDQNNIKTGAFDEHKVLIGFDNLEEAKRQYLSHYPMSMWPKLIRMITPVNVAQLKEWVGDGKRKTEPAFKYEFLKEPGTGIVAMDKYRQVSESFYSYSAMNDEYRKRDDAKPVTIPGYEYAPLFVTYLKKGEIGNKAAGYFVFESIMGRGASEGGFPTVAEAVESVKKRFDANNLTYDGFNALIDKMRGKGHAAVLNAVSPRYQEIEEQQIDVPEEQQVVKDLPLSAAAQRFISEIISNIENRTPIHSVNALTYVAEKNKLYKGIHYADEQYLFKLIDIAVNKYIEDHPGISYTGDQEAEKRMKAIRDLMPENPNQPRNDQPIRRMIAENKPIDNPMLEKSEFIGDAINKVSRRYNDFEKQIIRQVNAFSEITGQKIHVAKNEWFLPPRLRRQINAKGAINYTEGLWDMETGDVYILLNRIKNEARLRAVMVHEVVGHKGLRMLFGEKYNKLLDDIWQYMSEEQRHNIGVKYNTKDRYEIADEFLAEQSQLEKKLNFIEQAIAQIKTWLREIFALDYSDNDITYLMQRSMAHLKAVKQEAMQENEHGSQDFAGNAFPEFSQLDKQDIALRREGKLVTDPSYIRLQIIGEKGAERLDAAKKSSIYRDNLAIANKMEAEGKDRRAIFVATGWERGKEGKWRMEIPDIRMKDFTKYKDAFDFTLIDRKDGKGMAKGPLSYFVDTSWEGFNAYPKLLDMMVTIKAGVNNSGRFIPAHKFRLHGQSFDVPASIEIGSSAFNSDWNKTALIHELQHAIQRAEGFAVGSNPEGLMDDMLDSVTDRILERVLNLAKGGKFDKTGLPAYTDPNKAWAIIRDSYTQSQQKKITSILSNIDTTDKLDNFINRIRLNENRLTANQKYFFTAGEVEARNATEREKVSMIAGRGSLRFAPISSTEDVARDKQIVVFDEEENALVAFHGTNAEFDVFDIDKIGSGEGVQAFGHGMYFTDVKEVSEYYAKKLSEGKSQSGFLDQQELPDYVWEEISPIMQKHNISGDIEPNQTQPGMIREIINTYKNVLNPSELATLNKYASSQGFVYEIKLPDHFDWLRWDEHLPESQYEKIMNQAIIENINLGFQKARTIDDVFRQLAGGTSFPATMKVGGPELQYDFEDMQPSYYDPDLDDVVWISQDDYIDAFNVFVHQQAPSIKFATGEDVYNRIVQELGSKQSSSAFLERAGINGVKYPTGTISMGNPTNMPGGFNYVVFEPSPVEITNKLRFSIADNLPNPDFVEQSPDESITAEPILKTKWQKRREFIQDRMLSVRKMQELVTQQGGTVDDLSDVYNDENRSSSRSKVQMEKYEEQQWKPLIEFVSYISHKYQMSLNDIQTYLIAKHAPERNAHFNEKYGTEDQVYAGKIRGFEATQEVADHYINQFEAVVPAHDVEQLWDLVRNATKFTLDRYLEDGFMSRENYELLTNQELGYKNYVPLRGWKAETADEIFDYQDSDIGQGFNPFKAALGRESEADDPLPYIWAMANTAIVSGNKNIMKQKLLNLVRQNPERDDLFGVSKIYLVEDLLGNVSEEITRPDNELFELGLVKVKYSNQHHPRITKYMAQQHQVVVMEGGVKYVVTLKDPNVASAINGDNTYKPELTRWVQQSWAGKFARLQAALLTSKNPAFMPVNFLRDVAYAASSQYIQDEGDMKGFLSNIPVANKAIIRHFKGENISNPNELDKKYSEFRNLGGETGYVHLWDMAQFKRRMERDFRILYDEKKPMDKVNLNKVVRLAGLHLNNMAVLSENISRFSIYLTMLEKGMTKEQAVTASKNATVNFNRKGRVSGLLGSLYYFFNANIQGGHNLLKLAKDYPKQMTKAAIGFMTIGYLTSVMTRLLSPTDDKDGKKYYDKLSAYVKQNFMVLPNPLWMMGKNEDKFITIPLPWGFRALYGMGVIADEWVNGTMGVADGLWDMSSNLFDSFTPVNFAAGSLRGGKITSAKGLRPIVPSVALPVYDLTVNEDFAGNKIFRVPFTEQMKELSPASQMGMPYVNKYLRIGTQALNKAAGGDEFRAARWHIDPETGEIKDQGWRSFLDMNPSKVEHLLEGYTGGIGTEMNNLVKTFVSAVEVAQGKPEAEVFSRNIPILRRLYRQASPSDSWQQYMEFKTQVNTHDYFMNKYKSERDFEKYGTLRGANELRSMKMIISHSEARLSKLRTMIDRMKDQTDYERMSSLYDQQDDIINDAVKRIEELNDKIE